MVILDLLKVNVIILDQFYILLVHPKGLNSVFGQLRKSDIAEVLNKYLGTFSILFDHLEE